MWPEVVNGTCTVRLKRTKFGQCRHSNCHVDPSRYQVACTTVIETTCIGQTMLKTYKLLQDGETWRLQQQALTDDVSDARHAHPAPQLKVTSFRASVASAIRQDIYLQRLFAGKYYLCQVACCRVRSSDQELPNNKNVNSAY